MSNISNQKARINPLDPSTTQEVAERLAKKEEEQELEDLHNANFLRLRQIKEVETLKKRLDEKDVHELASANDKTKNNFAIQNGQITKDFEDLLKMNAVAFGYMSEELKNNDDFVKKCISINPSTYSYLSPEQQKDPAMINSYMNSRMKNSQLTEIGQSEKAWLPQKIDERVPKELAYKAQNYEKAYQYVLQNGPYKADRSYNEQYVYMLEYQKERGTINAQREAQKVLKENERAIMNLARTQPIFNEGAKYILDAAQQVRELQDGVRENQKAYWNDQKEDLLKNQIQENLGYELSKIQKRDLETAKLYLGDDFAQKERIAMQEEVRKRSLRILEEDMVWRKSDISDKISGLSDIGAIGQDAESNAKSRIQSIPDTVSAQSVETSSYACFALNQILSDIGNDYDNNEVAKFSGGAVLSDEQREEQMKDFLYSFCSGDFERGDIDDFWKLIDREGFERYEKNREFDPLYSVHAQDEQIIERVSSSSKK